MHMLAFQHIFISLEKKENSIQPKQNVSSGKSIFFCTLINDIDKEGMYLNMSCKPSNTVSQLGFRRVPLDFQDKFLEENSSYFMKNGEKNLPLL